MNRIGCYYFLINDKQLCECNLSFVTINLLLLSNTAIFTYIIQTKVRGFSQQANYIDRATAACQRSFTDRRCRMVSAADPHGRILGFLDPEPNLKVKNFLQKFV
jgi:hypothetical protein